MAIATAEGIIEFWTVGFTSCIKKVDTRSFAFKLMSYSLKNLVATTSSLYFNTYGGDFIKLKLMVIPGKGKDISFSYREKRRKNIIMFEDEWNALTILEKNEERLVLISGEKNSLIYGFSSDSHELIDLFQAPEGELITCMDAIILENINPIFTYGTSTQNDEGGKILLRKNWSNTP